MRREPLRRLSWSIIKIPIFTENSEKMHKYLEEVKNYFHLKRRLGLHFGFHAVNIFSTVSVLDFFQLFISSRSVRTFSESHVCSNCTAPTSSSLNYFLMLHFVKRQTNVTQLRNSSDTHVPPFVTTSYGLEYKFCNDENSTLLYHMTMYRKNLVFLYFIRTCHPWGKCDILCEWLVL